MKDNVLPPIYAGYRFPAAIIAHAVWLYFRFARSDRDVAELLAARGVILGCVRTRASGIGKGRCGRHETGPVAGQAAASSAMTAA